MKLDVEVVEELGSEAFVFGRTDINGVTQDLVARVDWKNPPQKGETVHVQVDADYAQFFDKQQDGRRVG